MRLLTKPLRSLIHGKNSIVRIPSASLFNIFQPLHKSHTEQKVIPFRPEEIFDVVADVSNYKHFLPYCVDSNVVHVSNENVFEASLAVGFKIFTEKYTSRILMKRPNRIVIRAIDSPTFTKLESLWEFHPGKTPNTCRVNFKVDFEVSSFLHSQAIELFFEDVAKSQLTAFIDRTASLQQQQLPTATPQSTCSRSLLVPNLSQVELSGLKNLYNKYAIDGKLQLKGFAQACMDLQGHIGDFTTATANPALMAAIFSSFEDGVDLKDWLTLQEFITGIYLMVKGTPDEKAIHLFKSIDTNRNNRIEREELSFAMNRKIDVVGKILPKVLEEQLVNMYKDGLIDQHILDKVTEDSLNTIQAVTTAVRNEIPIAVNQIFQQVDCKGENFITSEQWNMVWKLYPELIELMTIDGMAKMVQWASVVGHGRYQHCLYEGNE